MSVAHWRTVHWYDGLRAHGLVRQLGEDVPYVALGRFGVRNFPLLTLGFVPPIVEYLVVKLREFAFPGKFRRDLLHDRLETLSEPAVSCDGLVVPLESVARPEGVKVVEQTPCLKFLGV